MKKKTWFFNHRGCDYTRSRDTSYDISTMRESIRRRPDSLIALALLWWLTTICLAVLLQDPVPNGTLHVHLRSYELTMVATCACPLSPRDRRVCPIPHFSVQKGARERQSKRHYVTKVWTQRKTCEGLGCHLGQGLKSNTSKQSSEEASSSCFDFSKSIRANADYVINIHEPSSSIILSAIYLVISSRTRGSFVILSALFVGPPPLFIETLNDKQYLKHHHQS